MDFTSLIGFIVIAIISSLASKNKTNTASRRGQTRTNMPQRPATRPALSNGRSRNMTNPSNNRRKGLSAGLEDLFKELKVELDRTFHTSEREDASSMIRDAEVEYDHNLEKPSWTEAIEEPSPMNPVYDKEIGKEEIPLNLNRESIIQGIIMSEILQKPKALRR